nr:copia protein [Tanacetum cinerariifolium]
DSIFELTGFSNADYAGYKDTFKSTFGGAQFIGEKLVSWSSKKQDSTALSIAEAEYVSLSACCFIDVDHPSHVYKLKKALYRLKQAPTAWYDELSIFLLQNHFFKGTIDPTLFIRRFDNDILVVHVYVDDIIFGSTHPRPDIVHAACLCTWYQAKPIEKLLNEVKRIFRYLWRTVNTGLWYMKDSIFELTGFSNADYAGYKDTFKSTFGGAQFIGEKLVSWSSKKQDSTALSIAEAEYVSLSACCAQCGHS